MDNIGNTSLEGTQTSTDGTQQGKTFTQEDVNRIVQERLAKEKAKNSGEADLAKREQELAQRELHMTAKEMLTEKGLPAQLFDALNCSDEDTMKKSIATLETVFNEYKANISKEHNKPSGATPVGGVFRNSEDMELRRVMGLRT